MNKLRMPAPAALAAAALLGLALAGCSTTPQTGSVSVEVRAHPETGAAQTLDIEIRDANNTVLVSETLQSGQSRQFDSIPLGDISIEALGLCEVGTTLSLSGATAIFEPEHCQI